ncbi:MAG: hypothetical protein RSB95_05220 [Bacilli bacterium]
MALQTGATFGYMPSSIQKKALINQLVGFFYRDEVDIFAKSNSDTITLQDFVNQNTSNNYFDKVFLDITSKSTIDKVQLKKQLVDLRNSLNEFIVYYGGGEYYGSDASYGPVITTNKALQLQKTNNNEVERTIVASNNVKIYGLGFTQTDLTTQNIGIGNMKIKDVAFPYIKKNGNDVYQQLLFNNNSINDLAPAIYTKGIEFSKLGTNNMKGLATQAKAIIAGNLSSPIIYDNDGIGPNNPSSVALSGNDDFVKFNK